MDWTPQDWINLVDKLRYPIVGGLLFCFVVYWCRGGINNFISRLKKVDSEVGKDGLRFNASCEDAKVNTSSLDQPQQAKAIPQVEEDSKLVDEEEKRSLSDIVSQIKTDGIEAARTAFEENIKSSSDPVIVLLLRTYFLSRLLFDGNYQRAFDEYKEMYAEATDDKSREIIVCSWASCYSRLKQHEKAQSILSMGISDIVDQSLSTMLITRLAQSFYESSGYDKAVSILNSRIQEREDRHERAGLYEALSEVESKEGNVKMAALCVVKKAELIPEDANILIDAAYQLNQANVLSLSLHYYDLLLGLDPNHRTALNNIGVVANTLGLKIKAVEFQSKSADLKESLACANLGFAFLRAGFIEEAKRMAQRGLEFDPPHNNNYHLMGRIQKEQKEEEEKWEKFVRKSGDQNMNLSRYTDAYYAIRPDDSCPFVGEWIDQNGDIFDVTEKRGALYAKWERSNKEKMPFPGGLFGGKQDISPNAASNTVTKYEISGACAQNTAIINIIITETPECLLRIGPNSYYNLFSYIDGETGDWIVFSTDLTKSYEGIFKRPKVF
ncbi:MAG: tetratricopeptide repeat protein [Desulfovibrio sp.]